MVEHLWNIGIHFTSSKPRNSLEFASPHLQQHEKIVLVAIERPGPHLQVGARCASGIPVVACCVDIQFLFFIHCLCFLVHVWSIHVNAFYHSFFHALPVSADQW